MTEQKTLHPAVPGRAVEAGKTVVGLRKELAARFREIESLRDKLGTERLALHAAVARADASAADEKSARQEVCYESGRADALAQSLSDVVLSLARMVRG